MKYLLFLILSVTAVSAQQQYWVDAVNGNDGNNGLCQSTNSPAGCVGAPWKTLQKATTTAVTIGATTGTVVNFLPGNYPVSSSFNSFVSGLSATRRLTLQSTVQYGAVITFSCPQDSCWVEGGDFVTIKNFAFTGPSGGGFSPGLDLGNSPFGGCNGLQNPPLGCGYAAFFIAQGNRFQDMGNGLNTNSANCDMSAFFTGNAIHDVLIDSNIINRVGVPGGCSATSGTSSHGIYATGWNMTITNNQVSNAAGAGLEIYHNPCKDVIANNTVYHNYVGGLQMAGFAVGSGQTTQCSANDFTSITNNVFVDNGYGKGVGNCAGCGHGAYGIQFTSGSGTHNKASNNYLAGNWNSSNQTNNTINVAGSGVAPSPSGNIDGGATFASLFTNYLPNGSGDYSLASASPLKATGTASTGICAISPGLTPCVPIADFTGIARPATPSIGALDVVSSGTPVGHVSPTPQAFPSTLVGGFSATQLFTVSNTGTSSFTMTPAPSVTGANAADFPFAGSGTCGTNQVVAPGGNCTVSLQFHPSAAGAESAQLNIFTTASNGTQTAALSGTGTQPDGSIAASTGGGTLAFGNQAVNTVSGVLQGVLTSAGTGPLTIAAISVSSPYVLFSDTCPRTPAAMTPGQTCQINVKFNPLVPGSQPGTLTVSDNAISGNQTLSLTGTGQSPSGTGAVILGPVLITGGIVFNPQ